MQQFKIFIGKPESSRRGNEDNYWAAPDFIQIWLHQLSTIIADPEFITKQWVFTSKKEIFRKEIIRGEIFRKEIIQDFDYEFGLFQMIDGLFILGYLKDIKIYFWKEGVTQPIEFDQLSEGEKQRLALRGAMEIFRGKETLFLLDEPDAFAHPEWQWSFLPDLEQGVGENSYSQVIFATHSPLALSTAKGNAFTMSKGKIEPLYGTFGQDANYSLETMGTDNRLEEIQQKIDSYMALLEDGKVKDNETRALKEELVTMLGLNHPALLAAIPLETFFE